MASFRVVLGFVGVLACGVAGAEESSVTLFRGEGRELVEVYRVGDEVRTRKVEVNFHPLYLSTPPYRELIAKETVWKESVSETEGELARAQVEVFWKKKDGSFPKKADHVTRVAEATRVGFEGDHWRATIFGCCDAEPVSQLFAYGERQPFLVFNGRYGQLSLPNAGMNRYVGVMLRAQAGTEEMERLVFGEEKEALGAIVYGGPGMKMEKLFLGKGEGVSEDDVPYHTLDLDLVSSGKAKDGQPDEVGFTGDDQELAKLLILWSQDTLPKEKKPESVGGVTVVANFSGNDGTTVTVRVPVVGDKLVGEKAKVSGGGVFRVLAAKKP